MRQRNASGAFSSSTFRDFEAWNVDTIQHDVTCLRSVPGTGITVQIASRTDQLPALSGNRQGHHPATISLSGADLRIWSHKSQQTLVMTRFDVSSSGAMALTSGFTSAICSASEKRFSVVFSTKYRGQASTPELDCAAVAAV